MAGTLVFKVTDDLKRIVEHAAANDPGPYYGTKIARSVFLVKDRGAYLMSAGQPGLLRYPDATDHTKNFQVVEYAEGFNADEGYDYDELRAVCGGDDLAEPLDVDFFARNITAGAKEFRIKLTPTSVSMDAKF